MPIRSQNQGSLRRAFTLLEVLIVLSILIGISAVVLPKVLDRGLGDLRSDTQLRIHAALLDAQREARRTGQTVEILIRSAPGSTDTQIVIQPMPQASTHPESDIYESDRDNFPAQGDSSGAEAAGNGPSPIPESGAELNTIIAHVMPDGTLIAAIQTPRFEIEGEFFDLEIHPPTLAARLILVDAESSIDSDPVDSIVDSTSRGVP